jgi:GNAT superfamily N-acetyltransferase
VAFVPPSGRLSAVAAFTAHTVIAAAVDEDEVRRRLPADDLGAPMSPGFLLWLAGWVGAEPGVLDVVLACGGRAAPDCPLVERDDLVDHPRVRRAGRYREGLRVWTDESGAGVLCVGQGLAGRWEMAFEVDEPARDRGLGRRLAAAAATVVPAGEPVFAQVSPGNSQSLRSVLAAGYRAIGSEVLFAAS